MKSPSISDRIAAIRFVARTIRPYDNPATGEPITPANPSRARRAAALPGVWLHAPARPGVNVEDPEQLSAYAHALWALRPAAPGSETGDQWVSVYAR